jgi:hypothetical protein
MAVANQRIDEKYFDRVPGVELYDLVYVGADGKLDKAQADSIDTMPAIGWVIEVRNTKCRISADPLITGLSGIVNKAVYFVSTDTAGAIQDSPPDETSHVMQKVGFGLGEDKIYGTVDPTNYVIRSKE